MIRKLLFAGCLLFVVNVLVAQRFDAGIIAGLNATQVEGDGFKGYHKPGLLAGMFVQTDIAPTLFAGMEIKYSQKGSKRKYDPKQPAVEEYKMQLGYIDIPVFMGFRTNDRSAILGGITPGVLIHSKETGAYGEIPEEDQQDFNTLDLQLFLGFQWDFTERMAVDLRFSLSVIPCADKAESTYYFHSGLYNNVISLAVYYDL